MTSIASLLSPSCLPCPSSTIATDGELICIVLLNMVTLPENIASVPGRSIFDQWYWLKNVQVSCLVAVADDDVRDVLDAAAACPVGRAW